eukprot:13169125-Alexandrium_andersonii.AAC.1
MKLVKCFLFFGRDASNAETRKSRSTAPACNPCTMHAQVRRASHARHKAVSALLPVVPRPANCTSDRDPCHTSK